MKIYVPSGNPEKEDATEAALLESPRTNRDRFGKKLLPFNNPHKDKFEVLRFL
jgi:hypothetical protein